MKALSYTHPIHTIPQAMATPNTVLLVGIDVSSDIHVARAITGTMVKVDRGCSFNSSEEGLKSFLAWLAETQATIGATSTFIGMESTGIYWRIIYEHLRDTLTDCGVYLVFTTAVYYARKMRGTNCSKTDPQDAFLIAELLAYGKCCRPIQRPAVIMRMREGLNLYRDAAKRSHQAWQQLHAIMSRVFPEALNDRSADGVRGLYTILQDSPVPADIIAVPEEQWVAKHVTQGRGRAYLRKIYRLAQSAACTHPNLLCDPVMWQLQYKTWHCEQQRKEKLLDLLKEYLADLPAADLVLSISNLGELAAAAFLTTIGDITQFHSARQVEKCFGLDFLRNQSGNFDAPPRITKRGNAYARYLLFSAALRWYNTDPYARAWCQRRFPAGAEKPGKKITIALTAKLIRVLFSIVRSGTPYVPALAFSSDKHRLTA
jgi:transposase